MNRLSLVDCKSPLSDSSDDVLLYAKQSTISLQPRQLSKEDLVALDNVRKKSKGASKDATGNRTPPPPAVARRNARERNRVKQVNNGFANLRQHIPNSIAATFESGKNGNKKLSKVETLRMAVEYIKSLEELLELNNDLPNNDVSSNSNYQSSSPLTSLDIQSNTNYTSSLASPLSDDDISNNSTLSPVQYVKINGQDDTYQLIPVNVLQNHDILKTIKSENILTNSKLINSADVKFKNNTNPLSPEMYSENSLSPEAESDIQSLIPVFNVNELSDSIKDENTKVSNEEMRIFYRNLIMLQADAEEIGKQQLNVNELISW